MEVSGQRCDAGALAEYHFVVWKTGLYYNQAEKGVGKPAKIAKVADLKICFANLR